MNKTLLVVLAIVNAPVYVVLANAMFGGGGGLLQALRFWAVPDLISALRGEFWEDRWQTMKLGVWLVLCGGLVYSEYHVLTHVLHWLPG